MTPESESWDRQRFTAAVGGLEQQFYTLLEAHAEVPYEHRKPLYDALEQVSWLYDTLRKDTDK